jgi:hypothetical protein
VRTRSEVHGDGEPTSVDEAAVNEAAVNEAAVDEAAVEPWFSADDIFITAKSDLRERLPVSMRQGRHGVKSGRKARGRSRRPVEAPQRMYLVDGDGEAETTRIAQRLAFEDFSDVGVGADTQESVAG